LIPKGFIIDRAKMVHGLLYKTKKKRSLALEHLTEARRILSQFGQIPILAGSMRLSRSWGSSVAHNSRCQDCFGKKTRQLGEF